MFHHIITALVDATSIIEHHQRQLQLHHLRTERYAPRTRDTRFACLRTTCFWLPPRETVEKKIDRFFLLLLLSLDKHVIRAVQETYSCHLINCIENTILTPRSRPRHMLLLFLGHCISSTRIHLFSGSVLLYHHEPLEQRRNNLADWFPAPTA